MTATETETETEPSPPRTTSDPSARLAVIVFACVLAGALPLLLELGNYHWFHHDEWDFLAGRDGGNLRDLFIPHNEHWSTLPMLLYRGLYRVVGLRSYVPYQAVLVVLHLTAAALLRVVMRRAGVGPWIATAAASLFALFGSGHQNLAWAFQIGFVGSLVLGLTHLLLADHQGALDRRDWLGLLAGLAGLICSGVAVTMIFVVGLTALVRRGWRIALLHTAPLGVLYVVWLSRVRHLRTSHQIGYTERDLSDPGQIAEFVRTGLAASFDAMGQLYGFGILLAVVLVVGLTLALTSRDRREHRMRLVAPCALLAGAIVFLSISGLGRAADFGPEFARRSRYLHLVAALSLPAIAVGADAIARRRRLVGPVVLTLLVIGIPGNIAALKDEADRERKRQRDYRLVMLSFPRVAAAQGMRASIRPEEKYAHPVTLRWLREGVKSGRLPDPGPLPPRLAAEAAASLESGNKRTGEARCFIYGKCDSVESD